MEMEDKTYSEKISKGNRKLNDLLLEQTVKV